MTIPQACIHPSIRPAHQRCHCSECAPLRLISPSVGLLPPATCGVAAARYSSSSLDSSLSAHHVAHDGPAAPCSITRGARAIPAADHTISRFPPLVLPDAAWRSLAAASGSSVRARVHIRSVCRLARSSCALAGRLHQVPLVAWACALHRRSRSSRTDRASPSAREGSVGRRVPTRGGAPDSPPSGSVGRPDPGRSWRRQTARGVGSVGRGRPI